MPTVAELTSQKQRFKEAYEKGEITKAQYNQAIVYTQRQLIAAQTAEAQRPSAPLPTPYWNLGTEVPGSQPYVSGKPAEPAYVAPPGYIITAVEPQIKTTKVMGGDPFKGWSSSETTETTLNISLAKIIQETKPPLSSEAFFQLQKKTVSPSLTSMLGLASPLTLEQQIIVRDIGIVAALPVIAPAALPFVTAKGILIGEAIGVGATAVFSGGRATPVEYAESAVVGGAFAVVGSGVMAGVGKVAPVVYEAGLKGASSRIAVLTGLGGGASYVLSGGNLEATAKGAAFSAAFGTGFEAVGFVSAKVIQPRAQAYLTKHYLETGKLSILDKAIMQIFGVSSLAKEYIVSGQPVETWSLAKEEATINKALIPRDVESFGKKGSLTSWGKGTQWQKPPSMESTLNQWVGSGQAQQLIIKPVIAVELMPKTVFAPLVTLPKVAQKKTGKTTISAIPQTFSVSQIQNPFLKFSGKPFYQQRSREAEEEVYAILSYPKQSPLSMPKQIQIPRFMQVQTPALKNIQDQVLGISQKSLTNTMQKESLTQVQRQAQTQIASLRQVTTQKQTNIMPQFPLGGGEAGGRSFENLFGKWFGRKHPVKTWEAQLKTFGFGGKIPKSVSKLGKMEVPKGFKFGAPKKKRRRRKR